MSFPPARSAYLTLAVMIIFYISASRPAIPEQLWQLRPFRTEREADARRGVRREQNVDRTRSRMCHMARVEKHEKNRQRGIFSCVRSYVGTCQVLGHRFAWTFLSGHSDTLEFCGFLFGPAPNFPYGSASRIRKLCAPQKSGNIFGCFMIVTAARVYGFLETCLSAYLVGNRQVGATNQLKSAHSLVC